MISCIRELTAESFNGLNAGFAGLFLFITLIAFTMFSIIGFGSVDVVEV